MLYLEERERDFGSVVSGGEWRSRWGMAGVVVARCRRKREGEI